MPQPNLQIVEKERTRKTIKPWRSDAERLRLPTTTITGEKPLPVDEILQRTQRELPEIPRQRYYPRYLTLIVGVALLTGIVLLIAWIR